MLRPHTPIGKLTQQVIEGSCTDRDKAQKIYDWIAHNIAYDAQSHWSSVLRSQTPEEVLNSRLAVCDGYASLFQAMAEQSRLKSKKLYGMAKTAQEAQSFVKGKPNHAWNMVHFDGKWHFIDSTWGAGYTTRGKGFVREYRPQYFSLDPQSALLTHWDLEDSFGVQKQFNLSFEEFIRLPRPQTEISRLGFGPEMQLRLARLKSPAPLVTVYEGAEDYLSSDDPRALNRNLPREGYSFNLRLKKPSSLFLYANEQFLQIVHDNQNAVVHVPARMRGDIVLMAQIGPGEFRGLLEYHRP